MKGQVVVTAPGHKRPHDENHETLMVVAPVVGGGDCRPWPPAGNDFGNLHHPQDETSSHASSLKRARLFGEYRDVVGSSSFLMEEDSNDDDDDDVDDEEEEEVEEGTTVASNVAVRSASDDASTGRRWLLRSSPSSFSIASTLTELSDTVETLSCPGGADGALSPPKPDPCFLLEESPQRSAGDQVEALTGRMSSWSLTRMKTFRTSNLQSTSDLSGPEDEVMSETRKHRIQQTKRAKREFMRALRRSDSTVTD
jgi:hypothetical protein